MLWLIRQALPVNRSIASIMARRSPVLDIPAKNGTPDDWSPVINPDIGEQDHAIDANRRSTHQGAVGV